MQERGIDRLPDLEKATYARGERLEAYLTQPFHVAVPFSGKKGESVSVQDTSKDVQTILNGKLDTISVEEIRFIGKR